MRTATPDNTRMETVLCLCNLPTQSNDNNKNDNDNNNNNNNNNKGHVLQRISALSSSIVLLGVILLPEIRNDTKAG